MKDRPSLVDSKHHFNLCKQLKPLPITVQRENSTERRWTWNMRRQNPTQPQSSRVKDANMTNSTISEGWLVTVSTAQERSKKEADYFIFIMLPVPAAARGLASTLQKPQRPKRSGGAWRCVRSPAVCPAQQLQPASGRGRARPGGKNGEGSRWKEKAVPQPLNSSQSQICPPLPVSHSTSNAKVNFCLSCWLPEKILPPLLLSTAHVVLLCS